MCSKEKFSQQKIAKRTVIKFMAKKSFTGISVGIKATVLE